MKNKNHHNVGTFLQSNWKIIQRGKIYTLYTQIYDRSLSWPSPGTIIKGGGVRLVLWAKSSPITCMCPYVLSSVLWCPFRFPHKNGSFLPPVVQGSCLIYVICACLRIVPYNTLFWVLYFFVLCFVYSVSLGCPFLIAHSVFSKGYFLLNVDIARLDIKNVRTT